MTTIEEGAMSDHTPSNHILITGCAGLVGSALRSLLRAQHCDVAGLDLRGEGPERGDVRNAERVRAAVRGCRGVVHLAAVSRVVWGERDPELCHATNVGGLRNVIAAIEARREPPWLIFASSREVYGRSETLPVDESAPLRPVNVYARTKVEGEALVTSARERGVQTAIVRLSNVYGGLHDHQDRVVPAFVRAAVAVAPLRVEGPDHTFDFTHVDDTVRGLVAVIELLVRGGAPPPIHLLTGHATSLASLARIAVMLVGTSPQAPIEEALARTFDVAHFVGDPRRAAEVLGWRAAISLREGIERYVREVRDELGSTRLLTRMS
jgi:UDP-glucose 4-epimerase